MLINYAVPMVDDCGVNESAENVNLRETAYNHLVDMFPGDGIHKFHIWPEDVEKHGAGYILTLSGIKEDFRVTLDDKLVCECIYGDLYHENLELLRLLFS